MSEGSTLARLLEVAVGQHGFITPDKAAAAGVDPARLPVMLARGTLIPPAAKTSAYLSRYISLTAAKPWHITIVGAVPLAAAAR